MTDQQPAAPPSTASLAWELVADTLHDAFKGATDVDLDMLAAEIVDAIMGDSLSVVLRWYDAESLTDEGTYVLGRTARP